jgi:hypothetical protein
VTEGFGGKAGNRRRRQADRLADGDQFVDEQGIALHGLARQRLGPVGTKLALLHERSC